MYRIVTGKITERCEYPVSHRPNQTSRGPQADFLRNCAASLVFSGRRGVAVAAVHVPRRPRKVTERLFGHFSRFGAQLSRRCRGDVAESSRSVAQLSRNCRGVVAEMSRRCRGAVFFQKLVFLTISAAFPPKNLISTPSTTKMDTGVCPVAARVADGVATVIATTPRRAGPSRALAGCALGI